ncbi:MAG TPA: hypothetical protein VJV75_10760 [Candidatus Polarisedimenticolia bacterium]|nr:hypothetical protein [Candidatus Polarisedimenticolia bacterium]
MPRAHRLLRVVALAGVALLGAGGSAPAVDRTLGKDLRARYEGRTFRLRVDLRSAAHSVEPNLISLEGVGYGRETSPVMFYRLESVFVDRLTSEGGARLALTIYRSEDEARRMRAVSIPSPVVGNPAGANTMGAYARGGSTSVMVELKAGKKEPEAQRGEADLLMHRLFYLDGDPARSDLEAFVLEHRNWSVSRLATITGLTPDEVRVLTTSPDSAPASPP